MHIQKIVIKNFKCFEDRFDLILNEGLNILVGDNEVGKSTILEAINLSLSGWINGKYITSELTESLFNKKVVENYLKLINEKKVAQLPPDITIELFCDFGHESLNEKYRGDFNLDKNRHASGIRFVISFDEEKSAGYIEDVINSGEDLRSLPIEFCEFSWHAFSRDPKLPKTIHLKSALIDSSSFRYRNGADINTSRIIKDSLTNDEVTSISQAHRKLKDNFSQDENVQGINTKIQQNISDQRLTLQIETSTKTTWESSLIPHINDIPFQNIGKGEQCLIKTKLALQHRRSQSSNILLIEEPENHLSHSKLNELINHIKANHNNKQVLVSTHSSFVANKIGLSSLILLNADETTQKRSELRINNLEPETQNYFEKLSGYDTLRLILCSKAILVEGDCDELVIQRAYLDKHQKLPIENGVDVISVRSLAFKRFLSISKELNQPTIVVTDNDGHQPDEIRNRFQDYTTNPCISLFFDEEIDSGDLMIGDKKFNYNTLEPKLLKCNSLQSFNTIFGKNFSNEDEMHIYMKNNKTDCALKIFESSQKISFPNYILEAII